MLLPVRGRDVAAGILLWIGLVVSALSGLMTGSPGASGAALLLAGLVLVVVALSMVRPYQRPWPLAQWQNWQQRRAMALELRRPLSLTIPAAIRSISGLLIGEWLGARVVDHVINGDQSVLGSLPGIGLLLCCAVVGLEVLLES